MKALKKIAAVILCLLLPRPIIACSSDNADSSFRRGSPTVTEVLDQRIAETDMPDTRKEIQEEPEPAETAEDESPVDVDLTQFSAVMSYSELSQIIRYPEGYFGKTVRITGQYSAFYSEATGKTYYSVILVDQTACCGQAMEFVLKDGFPLPEENTWITVTGVLTSYLEDGTEYLTLAQSSYVYA